MGCSHIRVVIILQVVRALTTSSSRKTCQLLTFDYYAIGITGESLMVIKPASVPKDTR